MSSHIDRMSNEHAELSQRITALNKFIDDNPIFRRLPTDEQDLMHEQLSFMQAYKDVLGKRLLNAQK